MKGISPVISYMLVFLMVLSLTSAGYLYVLPMFSDMKAKSEFEYMAVYMKKLGDKIEAVARSGEGSKEYLTLNLEEGVLKFEGLEDEVVYFVRSNRCLERRNVTDLYFEFETDGKCTNRIILNYTKINITDDSSFEGFFELSVENVGYINNRPVVKVG